MRIDGSGARQLTDLESRSLWYPAVSPDGKKPAAHNTEVTVIYDLDEDPPFGDDDGLELPQPGDGVTPRSNPRWSPDSRYLPVWSPAGDKTTFYDVERNTYADFKLPEASTRQRVVSWLADGRAVTQVDSAIYLLDLETGSFKPIVKRWEPLTDITQGAITADGRWLYYLVTEREADIWTARFD